MHQFTLNGYDIENKTVGQGNASSSRVNLPKAWEGKKVAVVLLEPNDERFKLQIEQIRKAILKETENESVWLKYPKIIEYFSSNHNEDNEILVFLDSLTENEKINIRCKIHANHKLETVEYTFVNVKCESEHLQYYMTNVDDLKRYDGDYSAHLEYYLYWV